jgi:hypothetical protein
MKSELIVMLTLNDETVEDSVDVFNDIKYIPINYLGFKDIVL